MSAVQLVLAFGNLVLGTAAFVVAGIVGAIAADLALPLATAGQVLTVFALTYAVAAPLLALLTGAWPRRRALELGLLGVGIGCLGASVAPDAAMLFAARVVTALGAALFAPAAAVVAVVTAAPARRARALSLVFLGQSAAQVLGVPLGTWLAWSFDWRMAFAPVALAAGLCLLAVRRVVPAELAGAPASPAAWASILRRPDLVLAIALTALVMTGLLAPYTFLAPLLTALTGLDRAAVAPLIWVFGLAGMTGTLAGGWTADRLGPVPAMTLILLVLLPTFALMPFAQGALIAVILLCVVWSLFGYAFMSPQQLRLVTLAPALQAPVLALNASAIYLGTAAGGALGGVVVARAGPLALPWASLAMLLVTLAALGLSVRLSRRAGEG
jgi:predicted MFS family arabinose efflux permease